MTAAMTAANRPPAIVTTSWDDGHPLDERLADLLAERGVAGTYYVPATWTRPVMDGAALRRLVALGPDLVELGGHTYHHVPLIDLDDGQVLTEVVDGKRWLEDASGSATTSFCYPRGKFRTRHQDIVRRGGFLRARTTMALRTDAGDDLFRIPVTVQVYPHGRAIHLRHAVKEGNWAGVGSWFRLGCPGAVLAVVDQALARLERDGGILHLWGHSWELEDAGLWPLLTAVIDRVANRPGVRYLTNAAAYPVAA